MEGIIAGCDSGQEWLLDFWWKNYSAHNSYPVAFVDFGMTPEAVDWCRARGLHIHVPSIQHAIVAKEKIDSALREIWERRYGEALWERREIWFRKTQAFAVSPFPLTLWLDLDCEVRAPLDFIFNCLGLGFDIAIKKEPQEIQEQHRLLGLLEKGESNYNAGVIAIRKDASILRQWIEEVFERNDRYAFDQFALARAIHVHRPALLELPETYNWNPAKWLNPHAAIVHYHGGFLKETIKRDAHILQKLNREMSH